MHNNLIASIAIILLVSVTGCDSSVIMTTSTLAKNAEAYYQAELYEDAMRYCDRLCKRTPDDFDAFALRCNVQTQLGNNAAALEDALYAYDINPDEVNSLRLRSVAYSLNGMHMEAIEDLKLIVERSSSSCSNQIDLASEYEKLGDYKTAVEHLELGLTFMKEHAVAWDKLSGIYSMAAKPEFRNGKIAQQHASRAVKYATSDEERCHAWDKFGSALAESRDFARAIKAAKKAIGFTEDARLIESIKSRIKLYENQEPARYEVASQADDYWTAKFSKRASDVSID